ncbi:MAG TPA: hypothetical protein VEY31_05550 [Roseococcus sp.]|jgi:hypothetical protein|nr:hypothetical protein [Roseococcus sp.]
MMNPKPSAELSVMLGAIDSLRATVAVARALVQSGREVDLAGLDKDAERVCAAAACTGPAIRPWLADPLNQAMAEVERLSALMRAP